MQISVRSYLASGTVAVVGAGAVAFAPVAPTAAFPTSIPAPAVAEVALTGLSLSLTDVMGLLEGLGVGGVVPDFLTALPSLLPTDIVTAVVTEFVNQASPLVLASAGAVFDYLGAAVAGLISGPDSIPGRFGDALAAIPATLVSALQSLGTGDLATALQTVTDGLAGPVTGITAVLTDSGAAFQQFLTTEFNELVVALPGVLFSAVQSVITGSLQSLIDSINGALSGLLGGLIPGTSAAVAPIASGVPADRGRVALPAAAAVPVAVTPQAAATVAVSVSAADVAQVVEAQAAPEAVGAAESPAPVSASRARAATPEVAPAEADAQTDTAAPSGASNPAPDQRAGAGKPAGSRGGQVASTR